ncbi:MAG: hypothetical protein PVG85_00270 [Deltaproteobacteria bacterium]|jgi:hypothetical protein
MRKNIDCGVREATLLQTDAKKEFGPFIIDIIRRMGVEVMVEIGRGLSISLFFKELIPLGETGPITVNSL